MEVMSHYDVLGLPPSATSQDVRTAYKRLCLQLHPDKQHAGRGHEPFDAALFQRVVDAARCLQDPDQRALYDHGRLQQVVSSVGRVSSVVQFGEMECAATDELGLATFVLECRCGGVFELVAVPRGLEGVKASGKRHVECDSCSLLVQVEGVPS